MKGRSHYDVLGLSPGASPEAVREAYRRLAREFHPDRMVGSAAGGERMPMINEAYRVLSDPGRRAVYDAERRGAPQPAASSAPGSGSDGVYRSEPASAHFQYPEGPARVPWRGLLFCSFVAIVVIVVLAQFTDTGDPGAPDNILRNGDCVEILDNGDAKEVRCTGSGDVIVRQFITREGVCSGGYLPHRDRQGMGIACVEFTPETL